MKVHGKNVCICVTQQQGVGGKGLYGHVCSHAQEWATAPADEADAGSENMAASWTRA